jgi:hypothetical protein
MAEKQATLGASFHDGAKLIAVDSDRDTLNKAGAEVCIAGRDKVYGPYVLDRKVGEGNGRNIWLAFSKAGAGRAKPKTKAELEQDLANMQAEILRLKAAQPAEPAEE